MGYQPETPFDNIESALEYIVLLADATLEAKDQVDVEIDQAKVPEQERRKQALQLVNYKLDQLSAHLTSSRRILNDLRTLRRLLLEEREARKVPVIKGPQALGNTNIRRPA
jgi:hypothetical protein